MENRKNSGREDALTVGPRDAARELNVLPRTPWAYTKAGTILQVRPGRSIIYLRPRGP